MTEPAAAGSAALGGKVAVVTGAGRGLGRSYAVALATAGASVVVNDIDDAAAQGVVTAITAAGGEAVAFIGPVGPTTTADALVSVAMESFGRIDVMCTNAGVVRDRSLKKMSDDDFDIVIDTHLRGTFTCARAAARQFAEQGQGGRLILIGSPAGQYGNFGQTAYSAAKAGIVCLARTWALELKKDRVTVNAVIPVALTRMTATIPGLAEFVEKAERGEAVPASLRASGLGTADDVAPVIVFLASDASSEITGQAIGLGGDKLALWSHPAEVAAVVRDLGFDAEAVAQAWSATLAEHLQPVGGPP